MRTRSLQRSFLSAKPSRSVTAFGLELEPPETNACEIHSTAVTRLSFIFKPQRSWRNVRLLGL